MILYINGIDRTEYLIKNSLYIRKSIGNQTDVCDFVLHDATNNFFIQQNDYVVIEESSENIFAGYVLTSIGNKIGVGTTGSATWSITCKDISILTDKEVTPVSYVDTPDEDIVTTLISGYFTLSADVTWNNPNVYIAFENQTIRECLNQMAQLTGSYWFIDSDAQLHWRDISVINFSNKIINSQTPDKVTSFPPLKNSRIQLDSSNIINKVKVYGGISENATRTTDTFTYTSGNFTYQLTNKNIQSVRGISYYVSGQLTYSFGISVSYIGAGDGNLPISVNQAEGSITFESVTPDNATTVTVDYYYQTEIYYESQNNSSIGLYGLYEKTIVDSSISNSITAQAKANSLVQEYAFPRETISVDVKTSGFTPGDIISCFIPELNISSVDISYLVQENNSFLLLENSDYLLAEQANKHILRQIQEVIIRYDGSDNVLFTTLTIGKTSLDLIKSLASLQAFNSQTPSKILPARLSNFTPDLGVVTAGLGLFTDGGTATFSWSNYAAHTGVLIGVEDKTTEQYGIVEVIDTGTTKVKLGYLTGLPNIGTVSPSGWGIYTQNGYFTGSVVGSYITGGTITGQQITGGTVTGSLVSGGTVSGAVVTGNTIIGGTIATSTPPINSGNPGVIMDSTGLYGYGTAGLTFRLSSDPAIKPYFSSGTILNTVYEINTAAVLRTGTTNPRVQIDNSGIFAYDSSGVARFTVDVATGQLTASKGTFSGTVTASLMSAGTVTGSLVTAGTITASRMTSGTIQSVALNSNTVTGGTITGGFITGGTVSGGVVTGGTVTGGTISGNRIIGGTIQGTVESSGLVFRNSSLATNIMETSGYVMKVRALQALVENDSYLGISGHGFNQVALSSGTTINDQWLLSITSLGSIQITQVNGGATRYL